MKTIWKFPIPITDLFPISMPEGSEVLTVQMQHDKPCIWARVDMDAPQRTYGFVWAGTGHRLPATDSPYIGTVQIADGDLVFHLFGPIEGQSQ